MINKNKLNIGSVFSILIVLAVLLSGTGCTKHAAPTAAKAETPAKTTTALAPAAVGKLEDSLVAVWKLDKIEMPGAIDKATTFGSQAERDALDQKLTKYQEILKGLTVTFSADKKFQSIYGGQKDAGTWTVNRLGEVETVGLGSGILSTYQIVSIYATKLVVNYSAGDMQLLMTFYKK